jgi:hypothetical protein
MNLIRIINFVNINLAEILDMSNRDISAKMEVSHERFLEVRSNF